jgi:hypothetical protein
MDNTSMDKSKFFEQRNLPQNSTLFFRRARSPEITEKNTPIPGQWGQVSLGCIDHPGFNPHAFRRAGSPDLHRANQLAEILFGEHNFRAPQGQKSDQP